MRKVSGMITSTKLKEAGARHRELSNILTILLQMFLNLGKTLPKKLIDMPIRRLSEGMLKTKLGRAMQQRSNLD